MNKIRLLDICTRTGCYNSLHYVTDISAAAQFKIKLMFTGSRLPLYTYGAIQIRLINKEGVNETLTLTR